MIRAKTSIEELRPDANAKEVIEAAWDVNESIRAIAEELSPETRSAMLRGAISSQTENLLNNSIPKKIDSIPNSLRDGPSENETNHAKWHSDNFPKATVSLVIMKTKHFQIYINKKLQVPK